MKHYEDIFFDLDGTLTDSGPGIMNAVEYALSRFGLPSPGREALRAVIGPPLMDSFQNLFGFSEADAGRALRWYREYYTDRGIFENAVYPGIPELLRRLLDRGRRLSMATGKPEAFALRIAEHFGLAPCFTVIAGATMDGRRSAKEDIIRGAMDRLGCRDAGRVLMVGDRKHDVCGAQRCGIDCLGVLYGYGSREELTAAGARYLAESPAQAGDLILAEG